MEEQSQNQVGSVESSNNLLSENIVALQKQVSSRSAVVMVFSVIVGFFGFFMAILASGGPGANVMLNLFIFLGLPMISFLMSGAALVLANSEHSLNIAKILSQISKWMIVLMIAIPFLAPILATFFGGIWILIQRIF